MNKLKYQADLHNHTTASDGMFSPTELVHKAIEKGIRALGITDHDTIDGLNEAFEVAGNTNIRIIPGIEISVRFREDFFTGTLHLLAYFSEELLGCDVFVKETSSVLSAGRGSELTRSRIMAVNECFSPDSPTPILPRHLTEADIYAHGTRISRRHFALALQSMGIEDAAIVSKIIGNKSPAYVPSGSDLYSLHNYLSRWPFALVLAHPAAGSYPGDSFYKEVLPPFEIVDTLFDRFLDAGLAGLEVEYPGHTTEWKMRLREYLSDHNLYLETGGSDCHDATDRPLGVAGTGMDAVETIEEIVTRNLKA
jgi:3',5'-nucleoside bisphosphate phosphatase